MESLEEGVIWSISYAGLVELSERYLHIARLLRHLLEGSLMPVSYTHLEAMRYYSLQM